MQRLEVSGAVRPIYGSLGVKRLTADIQMANVTYVQRKIQLSGFSAYLDRSPSQLIRISRDLLNLES